MTWCVMRVTSPLTLMLLGFMVSKRIRSTTLWPVKRKSAEACKRRRERQNTWHFAELDKSSCKLGSAATMPGANVLDSDTRSYFVHVSQLLQQHLSEAAEDGNDAAQDIDVLLDSAFSELRGKEGNVSLDRRTSRIVESLLQHSKLLHLRQFFDAIQNK